MICYPWATTSQNRNIDLNEFPHVKRWLDWIGERRAVKKRWRRAPSIAKTLRRSHPRSKRGAPRCLPSLGASGALTSGLKPADNNRRAGPQCGRKRSSLSDWTRYDVTTEEGIHQALYIGRTSGRGGCDHRGSSARGGLGQTNQIGKVENNAIADEKT
jgi:hypothetical protein